MHSPTNTMPRSKRAELLQVLGFMGIVHAANIDIGEVIPFEKFYNGDVSDGVNLKEEYLLWVTKSKELTGRQGLVSICEAPFILTPDAKNRIMQVGSCHGENTAVGRIWVLHGVRI